MKDNFEIFPKKHIFPYDGMSITANVWNEAHHYHTLSQNAHQYLVHGSGIVSGLEVIASDPPSSVIYILPGVAIDTAGEMIVLSEPLAYDLGSKIDGKLHLMLVHREIKVKSDGGEEAAAGNAPAYLQSEFVIVARPELLDTPHVEIARVIRESGSSPVADADSPQNPGINKLDLRFRKYLASPPQAQAQVLVAVVTTGDTAEKFNSNALVHLVKPLADSTQYHLIIKNNAKLDDSIFECQLVYLSLNGIAGLDKKQADILQTFLQDGGKILIEISDPVNEKTLQDLTKTLGVKLEKANDRNPIFSQPNLFYYPPQGGNAQEKPDCWCGDGVVCTNGDYGIIWSGSGSTASYSRTLIRDAIEWGINLFTYLLSE